MARSVDNALSVLFAIAEMAHGEITLTRIARHLDMPKANILRILIDLEARGLIVRAPDRSIQLGFAVLLLASAFHARVPLAERGLPYLRRLRDITGETTDLQVAMGTQRTCIQQVESSADIKWAISVGQPLPIASGAAGKVLLAFLEDRERRALLDGIDYRPLTTKSVPDLPAFERELAIVARRGYALSDNETRMGASAAAAPVRDHAGKVVAAMTVAGPSERVTSARLPVLAEHVVRVAAELSAELGWRAAPAPVAIASEGGRATPAAPPKALAAPRKRQPAAG